VETREPVTAVCARARMHRDASSRRDAVRQGTRAAARVCIARRVFRAGRVSVRERGSRGTASVRRSSGELRHSKKLVKVRGRDVAVVQ